MKYLKYHKEYKLENLKSDLSTSEMIKEAVEDAFGNDITWGGSLLGRLINSSLRKFKIGFNYTRVSSLVKAFKSELDELLADHVLSDDDKKKVNYLAIRKILEQIYKVSTGADKVETKLDVLLGTKMNEGLIDEVIAKVEKLEHPNKQELLEKLRKFKADLLKLRTDKGIEESEGEGSEDEEETSTDGDSVKTFYDNTKSLLLAISKIHLDIKNNTVKFGTKISDKAGMKSNTFFDEKKYQQQRTVTADEIEKKISMAKQAVTIYTTKKNKDRVNFYTKEVQTYTNKLKNLSGSKTQQHSEKPDEVSQKVDSTSQKGDSTSSTSYSPEKEHEHELQTASYRFNEEVDAKVGHNEVDAKAAWNKVVNAYNKSGISQHISYIDSLVTITGADKIKEARKKIMEIGRQVVLNNAGVGKEISFKELITESTSTNDVAKSISLFGRILLAFSEDMGLLGSFGSTYKDGKATGGAGSSIKLFIDSFNQMKSTYPSIKKESLLSFPIFTMVNEADEAEIDKPIDKPEGEDKPVEEKEESPNDDEVKKSWFKFFEKGEQDKWKVTDKDTQLREDVEKNGDNIELKDAQNDDHIIKIVNLFGKAYDLYATNVIPSGRPNQRVSQKTLREYEYIGVGTPNIQSSPEGITPGWGPWVAKPIYNKWQNGVTKILEDKQYRRILANAKFVSEAESSTDTSINGPKKPGSGKTLLLFINDMLENDKGSFAKHRSAIFRKYFGADDETIKGKIDPTLGRGNGEKVIAEDNKGATDEPIFVSMNPGPSGVSTINRIIKFESEDKVYIMSTFKYDTKEKYALFKYQVSNKANPMESMITTYLEGQKNSEGDGYKLSGLGIHNSQNMEYFVGGADLDPTKDPKNAFVVGKKFIFKSIPADDVEEANKREVYDKIKFEEETVTIKSIEQLVAPVTNKDGKQTNKPIIIDTDILANNRSQRDVVMGPKKNEGLIKALKK